MSAQLIAFDSIEIGSSSGLLLIGSRPVIFAVRGPVTINGLVSAGANLDVRGAGGLICDAGTGGTGNHAGKPSSGGGGGAFGSAGAQGGASGVLVAGAGGVAEGNPELIPLRGGCAGGVGLSQVASMPSPRGAGGGALQISSTGQVLLAGVLTSPGGGGSGGIQGDVGAGAGAGSGGGILLEGTLITLGAAAKLTAHGAAGGGGSDDQTGGDGAPGENGHELDLNAAIGGARGGNAGAGGDGGVRSIPPTAGGSVPMSSRSGGGGGAGLGRIRLNASLGCSIAAGALIDPPQTTNRPDGGCL